MTAFAIGALGAVLLAAVLPRLHWRRAAVRASARAIFRCAGIPLRVVLQAPLPARPHVVVANHASYIDGIVLCAILPPGYSFVIKREVTRAPVVHFLLRRIGARFVERHDRQRGAADARAMLRVAVSGGSLAVFPEGTFIRKSGLQRFRSGAFAAAVAGGLDVVPLIIEGSRGILPAGEWLPRPGRLTVTVLPPIPCRGTGRAEIQRLAQASRDAMLARLGEPDLDAARETG